MIIGDTPAQLGQIKAADAMMIEGKIVTRDDYRALAAHADALRVALSNLHDIAARCDSWEYFPQAALDDASDALSATPQHHLRQVRATAGRDGFVACIRLAYGLQHPPGTTHADQYADSILAGKG